MKKHTFSKMGYNLSLSLTITLALSFAFSGCSSQDAGKENTGQADMSPEDLATANMASNLAFTGQEREMSVPSPDGRYRLECLDMQDTSFASGLYAYDTIRVVDTATGEIIWDLGSFSWPPTAVWSPDSRYLALNQWGWMNSFTYVVDTSTGASAEIPWPEDIPGRPDPNDIHYLVPSAWESDTVLDLTYSYCDLDGTDEKSRDSILDFRFTIDPSAPGLTGSSSF